MLFFLEDRVELIWDHRSQFDMLRLLFLSPTRARELAEKFDAIQQADSAFRNHRPAYRKKKQELEIALINLQGSEEITAELRALSAELFGYQEEDQQLVHDEMRLDQEIRDIRLDVERTKLDIEEARRALQGEERKHFAKAFPNLRDDAEYVLVNLFGDSICLICGSEGTEISERVRKLLEAGNCPVCESPQEKHEVIVSSADFARKRLDKLTDEVARLKKDLKAKEELLSQRQEEFEGNLDRRIEISGATRKITKKINKAERALPPLPEELEDLKRQVTSMEREHNLLLGERVRLEAEYQRVFSSQVQLVVPA